MKYDSVKLAEAIKKAVEAAQVHADDEDGGTCNFDSAYLRVPRMTQAQGKEIEKLAGVVLSLHNWLGTRILQIIGGKLGQGNRHTRMAEAMHKSLKADGIDGGMYYQMD